MEKHREVRLPPYVSYWTFRNFLDYLKEGMPVRIDRSYWGDRIARGTGFQVVAALKFLGLVEQGNYPSKTLRMLVKADGEERKEILRDIVYQGYGFVFTTDFDKDHASFAQLEDKFKDIDPAVARKCILFFIAICMDADISLSPSILTKRDPLKATGKARKGGTRETPSVKPPPKTGHAVISGNGIPLDIIAYVANLPEEEQDKFIKVYFKFKKVQKVEA